MQLIGTTISTTIIWTPILALILWLAYMGMGAVIFLESRTYGTDYLVPQGQHNPLDMELKAHKALKEYYGL